MSHPVHHLILPLVISCGAVAVILVMTGVWPKPAADILPQLGGTEPALTLPERKPEMNQLWQMIRQILALVTGTDGKADELTVKVNRVVQHQDAQSMVLENAIQAFATNAKDFGKALLGIHAALEDTNSQLSKILGIAQRIQSAVMPLVAERVVFIVGGTEVTQMQIKDNGVLDVSISAKDALGNPANLDTAAAVSWAVSDPSLASISPSDDGLTAKVVPVGPLGSFEVQCSIPAVGDEPALSGSLPVEVIASAATAIVLQGAVE